MHHTGMIISYEHSSGMLITYSCGRTTKASLRMCSAISVHCGCVSGHGDDAAHWDNQQQAEFALTWAGMLQHNEAHLCACRRCRVRPRPRATPSCQQRLSQSISGRRSCGPPVGPVPSPSRWRCAPLAGAQGCLLTDQCASRQRARSQTLLAGAARFWPVCSTCPPMDQCAESGFSASFQPGPLLPM